MKPDIIIGIDTGVNTGFAMWSTKLKCLTYVATIPIHNAILKLEAMRLEGVSMKVRIEDARLRKWFGKVDKDNQQGVGSVKRDAKILEDYCIDKGIDYEMVAPKNNITKMNAAYFATLTKWTGKTSNHSRDAGMLVFGY